MRVELFLISLIISTLGVLPHALSFQWEDEDSVIVEGKLFSSTQFPIA